MLDLPLPPPLMTSEPGSFARETILERKPQIIQQVIADNRFPPEIVASLNEFAAEIARSPIQPVKEPASDAAFWNKALAQYQGATWLEVPWYFAETFFYRKLLEATRYFQSGEWERYDPFQAKKQHQIAADLEGFTTEWDSFTRIHTDQAFEALLHSCLWGNRGDLSNFTVKVKALGGLAAASERQHIIIDDTERVRGYLSQGVTQIDWVTDNVGKELLFDLALASFLIDRGWARHVTFRLKDRPFFVSDATIADLEYTLKGLLASPHRSVRSLGERLSGSIASDAITINDHFFFTSCLSYPELPSDLWEDFSSSDLIVLKGDVNYRRILSDRHWPHDTAMEEAARYFPASFLTLRTLKGEIMVGLQPGQAEILAAEDPAWLIDGQKGLIQFISK